jgi:hypothetical protein
MAAGAVKLVTFSRSMISAASSASHLYMQTMARWAR